jgi:hypothetical protein
MKYLLAVGHIFLILVSSAQGGFRAKIYDPNVVSHVTYDLFEISPGSYFGAGISIDYSNNKQRNRLTVVGLNSQGYLKWMKTYGSANLTYPNPAFLSRAFYKKADHLIYAGFVLDSINQYIGTLIKFDTLGNIIWQKFYREPNYELVPHAVTPSLDGGFLITGYLSSASGEPTLLIKTDANGNELWRKKLNKAPPNYSNGKAIVQDSSTKKIIIGGYQWVNQDIYDQLLVTDSLGNFISRDSYQIGQCHDLIQCKDKKIVAVGTITYDGFVSYYTSYAVKFDINSPETPIWQLNDYDRLAEENQFTSVIELKNGNLLIAGSMDSLKTVNHRYNTWTRLVWLNANGKELKKRYYDYAANDSIDFVGRTMCVNPTSDGGWITSIKSGVFPKDPLFYVKYDSTGCDSTTEYCEWVLSSIKDNWRGVQFGLFPNPAANEFSITFQSGSDVNGVVSVYNDLGQIVMEEEIKQRSSNVKIKTAALAPGIYSVVVKNDNGVAGIRKLVVTR